MILRLFVAILLFVAGTKFAGAQQVHFIYLQTGNSHPFYVKLNNKVSSSSSAGYLILPKLTDGDYKLTVGFPRNAFPEENFQISVNKDNAGFLLKNFDDKGWGLFNMQTFSVVMGDNLSNTITTSKILNDDPFSKMLANVVKDSSILEKNIVLIDTPKVVNSDTLISIQNADKITTLTPTGDTADTIVRSIEPMLRSTITRTLNRENSDGVEMIYIDDDENNTDTIRVFIPAPQPNDKTENGNLKIPKNQNIETKPVTDSAVKISASPPAEQISDSDHVTESISKKEDQVESKNPVTTQIKDNGVDSLSISKKDVADTKIENTHNEEIKNVDSVDKEHPEVINYTSINSDCKTFASNDDFIKLRKKMAGENSNDAMIKAAKKIFRSTCFSTEQIKNLSFLFLNEEGRYQFFDAAYAFTSDSDQYHSLQSQLNDPYYINRFKAMIHK
ncbi:MAG: hypothetical protein ABIO81_14270 [Ginsengibacter sp.]